MDCETIQISIIKYVHCLHLHVIPFFHTNTNGLIGESVNCLLELIHMAMMKWTHNKVEINYLTLLKKLVYI